MRRTTTKPSASCRRPCFDKLRRGKVVIRNWHALNWETEERIAGKRGVDKRGAKSDEAYVREVLGDMANARNVLVINDEAHHAWRVPAESKVKGVTKDEIEEATKWVGGLDRIDRARGILTCYDFSATPFAPSGKRSSEEALFAWIVSDFGLNDAIESGLVKTPARRNSRRCGARHKDLQIAPLPTSTTMTRSRTTLNRRAKPEEPLPDLVMNGYYLLGYDCLNSVGSTESSYTCILMTTGRLTSMHCYGGDEALVRIDSLAVLHGRLPPRAQGLGGRSGPHFGKWN